VHASGTRQNLTCSVDDVYICVVDTRKFTPKTFLSVRSLMIVFGIKTVGKFDYDPDNLCDEFLSQGFLDIYTKSKTTTLGALIKCGLYDFVPELNSEDKKIFLQSRVRELQGELFAKAKRASSEDINQASLLAARCFDGPWARHLRLGLRTRAAVYAGDSSVRR
jgi:hypothetical protein